MDDLELYEEWAAECLTIAIDNQDDPPWGDAYEEMASELVSLANLAKRVAA